MYPVKEPGNPTSHGVPGCAHSRFSSISKTEQMVFFTIPMVPLIESRRSPLPSWTTHFGCVANTEINFSTLLNLSDDLKPAVHGSNPAAAPPVTFHPHIRCCLPQILLFPTHLIPKADRSHPRLPACFLLAEVSALADNSLCNLCGPGSSPGKWVAGQRMSGILAV